MPACFPRDSAGVLCPLQVALAQDAAREVADLRADSAEAIVAAEQRARDAQKTLDTLKDQYRRLQADFDNFRSRSVRLRHTV